MNRDWTDFARHVLLPGRPRLPEARTAVIGMTDVREAWEALVSRDLVPGPEREARGAFRDQASPVEGPRWQPLRDDRTETNEPPLPESVDAAVALACVREVHAVLDVTGRAYAQRVADDVAACVLWAEAVARDLARPDGGRYREMADPTATMIALWSTGYALDHVRDDTVVLVAPAL